MANPSPVGVLDSRFASKGHAKAYGVNAAQDKLTLEAGNKAERADAVPAL